MECDATLRKLERESPNLASARGLLTRADRDRERLTTGRGIAVPGYELPGQPTRDGVVRAYVTALLALADDIDSAARACTSDDVEGETVTTRATPTVSAPAMATLAYLEARSFRTIDDIAKLQQERDPINARQPRTIRAHLKELQRARLAEANAETKQGFRLTAAGSALLKAHAKAEQ